MTKTISSYHPGTILNENFLKPNNLSQNKVAMAIGVDQSRISQLCRRVVNITPEMAMRLGKFFGNGYTFWMDLQQDYYLRKLQQSPGFMDEIKIISPLEKQ